MVYSYASETRITKGDEQMSDQAKMTSSEYIQHHLQHWQFSLTKFRVVHDDHSFWVLNLDTIIVSVVIGLLFLGFFYFISRRVHSDHPNKLQNFLEMLIDSIDNLVKETFHTENKLLGPLALTIFVWVFLMNFMDLVPVDLLPKIASWFGVKYFKSVPTADPMTTFALSISVFILIIYYNFKYKGRKLLIEVLSKPFGWFMMPINIVFRLIEEFVKPMSLSLRLFGNLFAGEVVFILIAIMPPWIQWLPGGAWSIFHILVITIQAFIFMMLTVVYLAMASETH